MKDNKTSWNKPIQEDEGTLQWKCEAADEREWERHYGKTPYVHTMVELILWKWRSYQKHCTDSM